MRAIRPSAASVVPPYAAQVGCAKTLYGKKESLPENMRDIEEIVLSWVSCDYETPETILSNVSEELGRQVDVEEILKEPLNNKRFQQHMT